MRNQFDVIHFHEPFPLGSLLSLFLSGRSKVVITWHSDIIRQKLFKPIVGFFQRLLCRRADLILTSSKRLLNFSAILPEFKDKIKVIPFAIDPDEYKPVSIDLVNLPDLPSQFVLYFGRIAPYKGLEVLIKALKYVDWGDWHVIIAGDGSLKEKIRQKISETGLENVKFIDRFISDHEKNYLLNKCEVFLFPSILPSEAYGIAQMEAMIYGKPIINTDLPTGVPWVSQHMVTGITVETGNPQSLGEAIDRLIHDDSLRSYLGANARKRALDVFSSKKIHNTLLSTYDSLVFEHNKNVICRLK